MPQKRPRYGPEDHRYVKLVVCINEFHKALYEFLRGMGASDADAKDTLQKLWLYVQANYTVTQMKHLWRLRSKAKFLYFDECRKISRQHEITEKLKEIPPVQQGTEVGFWDERKLEMRIWENFPSAAKFSAIEKKIIWYKLRYGYTFKEIEEKLGVSSSTAHDFYTKVEPLLMRDLEG